MHTRKLLTLTLVLSTLAVYPLSANIERGEYETLFAASDVESHTLSERIAAYLEEKGLEKKAAQLLTQKLVGKDEAVFTAKAQTLLSHCHVLSSEALINYLGEEALHRRAVALDSYGDLVGMVTRITHHTPTEETLETLSLVAKLNRTVYG